jgi:hypothetical protein
MQGNGVASVGWSAVSTSIIHFMRAAGYRLLHWSAIAHEVLQIVCCTFNDDTDLVGTAELDAIGEDIHEEMQNTLDSWEGGLKATGRAILPNKSYWYIVNFKCSLNGKWSC